MINVKALADKLNIKLSGYSPNTFEESFADDWLKKADKTANRASFKELQIDRKSTRLNSSHSGESRMPSSA